MHGYVTSGAGWFVLALVNAGLAQGKHRSGWNWFCASLFLGPFATLTIVMWPPLDPPVQPARQLPGADRWN